MKTKNLRSIFIIALMAGAFTFCPGLFPSGNIALAHTESEKAEANASKPVSVPSPGKLDLVEAGENSLIANIRQLTFSGAKAGEGYFSHDGRQMIFQSDRDPSNPFYQIYLMDLASGKTRRLSPGHGKTTCSWLHPSNKKALFSSTHLDPDTKKKEEQEIANRNSSTKQKYSWNYDEHYDIFEVDLKNPAKLKRLTDAVGYDAEASYSPDGKYIAFASNRAAYSAPLSDEDKAHFAQDAAYMMDIYIMKADGSDVRQLTTAKGYDGGPFFSADGKKITWRRFTPDGQIAEIYTMNVDGTDQKPLTNLKSMSWAPYFHPSGDYVVFTTNIHGYDNFELYIVDAQGARKPVRVTFAEGFDGLPVFTPDGKKLSWTKRSANGDSQIVIADWNDTEARRLLHLSIVAPKASDLAGEIRHENLRSEISYLAQPRFAGRKTGSAEEQIYTEKLAELFRDFGLKPYGDDKTFLERFSFTSDVTLGAQNELDVTGLKKPLSFKVSQDWTPLSFSQKGAIDKAGVVFAGYGIVAPANGSAPAYDSYKDLDVKGKWVLALRDVPANATGPTRQNMFIYSRPQHKATVARQRGAVGLILVNGPSYPSKNPVQLKFEGSHSDSSLAILAVTDEAAEKLLAPSGKKLKDLQADLDNGKFEPGFEIPDVRVNANIDLQERKSTGTNVLGILRVPGAKKTLMIGAHGDHLGLGDSGHSLALANEKSRIHFGADDNASGVASVLEIARYFAHPSHRKGLKQNLAFAIWSGEEIGVLGSTHHTKSRMKDLATNLSGYINLDMVGRLRGALYVQGTGSSLGWKALLEELAPGFPYMLTTQEDPYLPTDAVSFYLAGVPSISMFTGSHSEYHTPRDTPELINYPGAVEITKATAKIAELIASRSNSVLEYRKVEGAKKNMEGRSFRLYLGTIPDYSQEGVKGVRISGVTKDSPAETSKLAGGDIIVELDKNKIENLYDYVYALQSMKPDKPVSIVVLRAGQRIELNITPKLKE